MSLGLPLLLGYLTWSTVDTGVGGLGGLPAPPASIQYKVRDGGAPSEVPKRDPFSQDVQETVAGLLAGPAAAVLGGGAAATQPGSTEPQMKLTGTAVMGKLRLAFIDGLRLREGDHYNGRTISVIAADRVILTDAHGLNLVLLLDVATSDEVEAATAAKKAVPPNGAQKAAQAPEQPPLQKGIAALTSTGSQADILRMLGIPES